MATALHTVPGQPGEGGDDLQVPPDIRRREDLEARIHSFGDLLYQEPEHRDPLLGPLVRRGWRTMIAGYTGEGKSTVIGRMTKAILTGGEFLGWNGAGNGAKVLYIDLEQDLIIAQRRIVETWYPGAWDPGMSVPEMIDNKLVPELSNAYYCRWSEGLSLNASDVDRAVVEETIAKVEPDLVVFDPLYKGFEGNPNEQELAVAVMRLLDAWREQYGFGLVIGAHMRKPSRQGASFTKHEVSASGAWIFGAEVVLGIRRLPGNGAAFHFFKDRAGDLPGSDDFWTLEYGHDRGFRRTTSDADDDGSVLPAHERIWRLLQEVPGKLLPRTDISTMLHMPMKTVRNATEELVKRNDDGRLEGLVVETGANKANLYGFRPSSERLTLDKMREMFEAATEDEG